MSLASSLMLKGVTLRLSVRLSPLHLGCRNSVSTYWDAHLHYPLTTSLWSCYWERQIAFFNWCPCISNTGHYFSLPTSTRLSTSLPGKCACRLLVQSSLTWLTWCCGFDHRLWGHHADRWRRSEPDTTYLQGHHSWDCEGSCSVKSIPADSGGLVWNLSWGWPETLHVCRLELTAAQGCLMWGSGVRIPKQLHAVLLLDLHTEHMGVTCMKSTARHTSGDTSPNVSERA